MTDVKAQILAAVSKGFPYIIKLPTGTLKIYDQRGPAGNAYAAYFTKTGLAVEFVGIGPTPEAAVDDIGQPVLPRMAAAA